MSPEFAPVLDVAIDARSGGADRLWTYRREGPALVGDSVLVPLGSKVLLGYVFESRDRAEEDLGFPIAQLKAPIDRVEGLELPTQVVELVKFVAKEYLCSVPSALSAAVPPGARERLVTAWRLVPQIDNSEPVLTPLQREILQTIKDAGGVFEPARTRKLEATTIRALKLLRQKGLVDSIVRLSPMGDRREATGLLRMVSDASKIERFLVKEGKRKPAQAVTLMRLQSAERATLTSAEIRALGGVTEQTIKALLTAGLLEPVLDDTAHQAVAPTPTTQQEIAINAISDSIRLGKHRSFLLYGITGSGKTEVFLRAAAEALRSGRQVLYLVPEIALATQAIGRLRERFGRRVAILHSELPARERLETWMRIRNGETPIVLGARSAVFAPLANIGLVVVDEEHESSYKQESTPRYHAKRLAQFLAETHNAPLVLGSATPSVEAFFDAESGKHLRLDMPQRAASAQLPTVHIVDLTEGYRKGRPALLGHELLMRLEDTLKRKEQAIIFLNRRAYAPFLKCRDCGIDFRCPQCTVSLAYSRKDRKLRCHHCGYTMNPPDKCPSCSGTRMSPLGVGTERVEEALGDAFPGVRLARLDRDVAQKKGMLEEILAKFRARDLEILVGTQMVAKGLDFPGVTLVGVVLADVSLNIPDFRASERTFQLLSQVAGRAGRGTAPGHVIIQTFNPRHFAVECARTHDFLSFYQREIEDRRQAVYPPFVRLINIGFTGESKSEVDIVSKNAAAALVPLPDLTVLGPVDCAIEKIQRRWRRHLLIKVATDRNLEDIGEAVRPLSTKTVSVIVDVDPYSLV